MLDVDAWNLFYLRPPRVRRATPDFAPKNVQNEKTNPIAIGPAQPRFGSAGPLCLCGQRPFPSVPRKTYFLKKRTQARPVFIEFLKKRTKKRTQT
jgi:hypothetical protein